MEQQSFSTYSSTHNTAINPRALMLIIQPRSSKSACSTDLAIAEERDSALCTTFALSDQAAFKSHVDLAQNTDVSALLLALYLQQQDIIMPDLQQDLSVEVNPFFWQLVIAALVATLVSQSDCILSSCIVCIKLHCAY